MTMNSNTQVFSNPIDKEKLKEEVKKLFTTFDSGGNVSVISSHTANIEIPNDFYDVLVMARNTFMMAFLNDKETYKRFLQLKGATISDFTDNYYQKVVQLISGPKDGKKQVSDFIKSLYYIEGVIEEKIRNGQYKNQNTRSFEVAVPGEVACIFAVMTPAYILVLKQMAQTNEGIAQDLQVIESKANTAVNTNPENINVNFNSPLSALPFVLSYIVYAFIDDARKNNHTTQVTSEEIDNLINSAFN